MHSFLAITVMFMMPRTVLINTILKISISINNCYHQHHHNYVLLFERRSYSVAKDELKLIIFLSQPPEF